MRRTINISRPDPSTPWGFRIQGGRDFGQQLRIASVTPGGLAERNGVQAGDQVITIGGDLTVSMTHQQAQQAVIRCCNQLEMELAASSHVYSTEPEVVPYSGWSQAAEPTAPMRPTKTQSTVNINLHKPSPSSHSSRGAMAYPENGASSSFGHLENYAPRPFVMRSITQPSITETVPRTKPIITNQTSTSQFRPALYKTAADRGTVDTPTSAPVPPTGMKAATMQPQNARRQPICHYCKTPIYGPFVDAVDHYFCPEHFFCFTCRIPLNDRYFAEEDGKFYCHDDFVQHIASRCAKCGTAIIGTIIKALDKSWHPNCFVCCYCKRPLQDKFHVEDADQVLCEEHWQQLHLTECAKCKQSISEIDRFIEAFGKQFHAKCFCCAACQCPLEGKPFHSRDNKPFCRAHANAGAIFG